MQLPAELLALAEGPVNRMLAVDPELMTGLAELQGSRVGLCVDGLDLELTLYPGRWGLRAASGIDPLAQVTVRGAPLALARMLRPGAAGAPEGVDITGDVGLGNRLRQLFARSQVDAEEVLASVVGDGVAHQVGYRLRGLWSWRNRTHAAVMSDTGEYLQEEVHAAPTRLEVETQLAAIDELRDDVERLEARVLRLLGRRGDQA